VRPKVSRAMRFAVLALLPMLGGCLGAGNDADIYGSFFGQRIVGDENSVIVSNVWNERDAFPLADTHCHRYGRSARFKSFQWPEATFDCVSS